MPRDVGQRNQPRKAPTFVEHDQAPNAVPSHERRHFVQRGVLSTAVHLPGYDGRNPEVGEHATLGEARHAQVAIRHDSDKLLGRVQNRNHSAVAIPHDLRSAAQRLVNTADSKIAGHDVLHAAR
jgi:hypothetical protein